MINLRMQWRFGLCALGASLCTASFAADIYRVESPDGSFHYATQPLDTRYKLYLKGEAQPASLVPQSQASAATLPKPAALEPLIQELARKHAVDTALVRAVIEVESDFNPQARSAKGAVGAMQLMPATAARYGVTDRNDPAQNIEAGIRYLKALLALHNGNVALALASYNAGEGTVARHGRRIPPYKETMLYVPAVLLKVQTARTIPAP